MSLVSVAESKFPSPLRFEPTMAAAEAEGQNTEGTGRERASERYHLSGKQSGKSDRVLDIDTALPFSLAVAAQAPARAGRARGISGEYVNASRLRGGQHNSFII